MRILLLALAGVALLRADTRAQDKPITLEQIYAEARARSPRLAAARALTDAAAALIPGAKLPPDPQLQLGAMNFSLPGFDTNMPTSMMPSIQLMQMLPFPGKLSLSGDIARQSRDAAREQAEETWWELRAEVAMRFYELYSADRQLVTMRETVKLLENFKQVARAMYGAGEGRQADVLRASVDVARMQADIKRMEAMRTAAAARLNGLLNRPAETPIPTVAEPPLPATVAGAETLNAWAEATRPMLARGRVLIDQADSRVRLARREIWPDFTLGVQYGQRPGSSSDGMESGTERMGSVMLGFSVPVFTNQRQKKMQEEARAMRAMASADLADMRAQVNARIGELLAELERSRALVELYRREVLPQAQATVQSALSSYRVGQVDFMTLVDGQMMVNRYKQEMYELLAEYGVAIAELEMTIGRELPHAARMQVEE